MIRTSAQRGLTLLESVLAIAILAAALMVCLELRAGAIRSVERVSEEHSIEREIESLFEMARTGVLGEPESEKGTGTVVWIGDHLGKPYRISASIVQVQNPVPGIVGRRDDVNVWRYALEYEGQQADMLWY